MIIFTAGKDDIAIELLIFKWWQVAKTTYRILSYYISWLLVSALFHMSDLSMGHWHAILQYRVDIGTRQKSHLHKDVQRNHYHRHSKSDFGTPRTPWQCFGKLKKWPLPSALESFVRTQNATGCRNGRKLDKVKPKICIRWREIISDDLRWYKMVQHDPRWCKMIQDDIRW